MALGVSLCRRPRRLVVGSATEATDPPEETPAFSLSRIHTFRYCPDHEGFHWARADEEHPRTVLRHVCEHQDEARAKGAAAAREMAAKWTWRKAAEKIAARREVFAP